LVLLSLVAGYWVLTLSNAQSKPLNTIGKVIGYGVILAIESSADIGSWSSCIHFPSTELWRVIIIS
jgi:hypothetical protein